MDPSKAFVNNFTNAAVMLVILSITAIVDFARDNNVVGAGIGGGYDESGGTVNISGDAIVCAQTGLSSAAAIGKGKGGDANGGLRLADDLTVMAGKSLDSANPSAAASARRSCPAIIRERHSTRATSRIAQTANGAKRASGQHIVLTAADMCARNAATAES